MASPLRKRLRSWRPGGPAFDPFLIAEAGVNHEGNLDVAYRLIDEAKRGGADAIKFQTYRASTIASIHSPAYWDLSKESTTNQYELFKKYDRFWKPEFEKLKQRCDEQGIEFLSTPFDFDSATFLNDLMDAYKISSSDITNKPFIQHISQFEKPIVLSTGASTMAEIDDALDWINPGKEVKKKIDVALLHCVLNYPTSYDDANLGMIAGLRSAYPDHMIGYSDHTLPEDMSILRDATLLGAEILEKHFTHDKSLPGNDHYHAMDCDDLLKFKKVLDQTKRVLGKVQKEPLASEEIARANARRSIVLSCDLPRGETLTISHLEFKRPGSGISPSEIDDVIGRTAVDDLSKDDVLSWEKLR